MNERFTYSSANLAHPGKRYQGQFIDGVICLVIFGGMIFFTKAVGLEGGFATILIIGMPFAYFTLSDALPKGQSIGKMLLNISVVSKSTGTYCTVSQSIARNILTPILGVLDAALILTKSRQRLGDKIANTIVIKNS